MNILPFFSSSLPYSEDISVYATALVSWRSSTAISAESIMFDKAEMNCYTVRWDMACITPEIILIVDKGALLNEHF